MPAYTEDHLVEQPAIQLMQDELGWDVANCYDEWNGGVSAQGRDGKREGEEILNVGFWILNGRGRSQVVPWLNPDLPGEAIEGAVEDVEILNDEFWILNGRRRRQAAGGASAESEFRGGGGMSALVDGFQYFWRFHRLVKLAILLKRHSIFTESEVSRMRERGDYVKIRPSSACALARFGAAGLFVRNPQCFSNPLTLSEFLFNKKTSA